ncbi:MAG: Bax inhibitor-1/YccA family protein, partial [Flavobacteriales bacterium]
MENTNFNVNAWQQQTASTPTVSKTFMAGVFSWMGVALGISALTAYIFGTDMSYMSYLVNEQSGGLSGLGYVVMFAPIGFVLLMSFGFHKLSSTALTALFLVYSVIMGMSLSFIFLAYTMGSIAGVFITSAAMFGVMALLGYTTNTDLTKMGSILMMALIGIIIASLVNMFLKSDGMGFIISIVSVIIFT